MFDYIWCGLQFVLVVLVSFGVCYIAFLIGTSCGRVATALGKYLSNKYKTNEKITTFIVACIIAFLLIFLLGIIACFILTAPGELPCVFCGVDKYRQLPWGA